MSESRARGRDHLSGPTAASYYFCLWQLNLLYFLVLDFSKRLDDLLLGLSPVELAANTFVPLLLSLLTSALLAAASLGVERVAGPRPPHFAAIFLFLTINLWSFKIGLAMRLQWIAPGQRLVAAVVALLLTVALAVRLSGRGSLPWQALKQGRKLLAVAISALLLASFLSALARPPVGQAPGAAPHNIIIVSFDALSAYQSSLYGYPRQTTPVLTNLARESWTFDNFRCNFTTTGPALVALSGSLPIFDGSSRPSEPGLFEVLRTSGYPHRAFFSYYSSDWFLQMGNIDGTLSLSGRETALYKAFAPHLTERQLRWTAALLSEEVIYFWPFTSAYDSQGVFEKHNPRPARQSFADALGYLREHRQGALVWIHLWEPHYPYWPEKDLAGKFGESQVTPEEFINRFYSPEQNAWVDSLRNRYDETLAGADRQLGIFLQELKKIGLYDTSWIIVTSDHGESFDQGYVGHSGPLVPESICRVPFLLRPPGGHKAERVATPASQVDLLPTLLALLKLPPQPRLPGESLLTYLENPQTISERPKFTVSESTYLDGRGWVAVVWTHYKLEYLNNDRSKIRLFDLSSDPGGRTDIAQSRPDLVQLVKQKAGL